MKKYKVTITEMLKMTVEVEAEDRWEAEYIVSDKWHSGEYILMSEDFAGVEFKAFLPERDLER